MSFPQLPDHLGHKPSHTIRPHHKSRRGCIACKVRKVKCDEGRPACEKCLSRGQDCVYAPYQPRRSKPSNVGSSSASPSTTSSSSTTSLSTALVTAGPSTGAGEAATAQPCFRPAGFEHEDMKLLWFYTESTHKSFSVQSSPYKPADDIMKTVVMRHAFQTPFLLDTILAMAGTHGRKLGQSFDSSRLIQVRENSVSGYRLAIEEPQPETYPALVANSLILTALSAEGFRYPEPNGKDVNPLYILQWLIIWRGIGVIRSVVDRNTIVSSGLAPLFHRPVFNLKYSFEHVPRNLMRLIASISPDDREFCNISHYNEGLKYLGTLYQNLREGGYGSVMKLRIITWFTFLPAHYCGFALQKRKRALIILAHYAAFLKLASEVWWLEGVGQSALLGLCHHLMPKYSSELDVPLRAIHIDDQLELARLLLDDPYWDDPVAPGSAEEALSTLTDVGWVDDEGRVVYFDEETSLVKLVDPKFPGEEPVWHEK